MSELNSSLDIQDEEDGLPDGDSNWTIKKIHESSEEARATEPWTQKIRSLLCRVGSANIPVLLRGETGVGKEVVARQLHAYSKRSGRPFVKVNCAALPSELVESELFGYEKGAFTGAFRNTPGRFEMANLGTILLDEIGDMDLKLQAKLLQVLQDGEFHRLGANHSTRVDVRIMAASHCDFEEAISKKRFREDLFYRLNIVDVKIPPLRERRNEVLPLCEFFLEKYATAEWPKLEIPLLLGRVLLDYRWPGNVRELENVMRKYLVLRSASMLTAEIRQLTVRSQTVFVPDAELTRDASGGESTIPQPAAQSRFNRQPCAGEFLPLVKPTLVSGWPSKLEPVPQSALSRLNTAKRAAEAEAILSALNSTMWNRKRAAILLKIDYKALLYKMKKLGISEERIESVG